MSADDALQSLLLKMHRRDLLPWQEELRFGKPIYDGLFALVRSRRESQQIEPGALTAHQTANALTVLHRLRAHGSDEEVFAVFKDSLSHSSERVRDQAAGLVVGMMRQHDWHTTYYNDETLSLLREVMPIVGHEVRLLIADLLVAGPDAVYGKTFARDALKQAGGVDRLETTEAVVLERLARGAGATNWYLSTPSTRDSVIRRLSPGSVVSFFFDGRFKQQLLDESVIGEIRRICTETGHGDAIVGRLADDGVAIEAEVIFGADLADYVAENPDAPMVFYGRYPGRDNDGINAITITIPDRDGVVRSHPH